MARPGTKPITKAALERRLRAIALDLRWTWCSAAARLFAAVDPVLWEATNHAPLTVLRLAAPARLAACAEDRGFLALLAEAEERHRAYYAAKPWFARKVTGPRRKTRVAYFCSEYAVHESVPQYSGGLGVLAGDHLKSASDLGVPLVAVGLLYRHGYYRQELREDGSTRVLYADQDFAEHPIVDTGVTIECPVGSHLVAARVWRMQVGRVPLYLLDADLAGAPRSHRELTFGLYEGDSPLRLRQQALLGIGGVRALAAMGETPDVFHLNEGHAALASIERLRRLVQGGTPFAAALEHVRASTVFTTHTPVPAGHDRYAPALVARVVRPLLGELGLSARELVDLGRERPGDAKEPLCMTVLALRTAAHVNGVSALHGEVSRAMWQRTFGARTPDDVPIGHVTNGVHTRTWIAPEAEALFERKLRPRREGGGPHDASWSRLARVTDAELWDLRSRLRRKLVAFVRERLVGQAIRRGADVGEISAARATFSEDALTIGFARRFATYKRAPLVFRDVKRLARILSDEKRPVQLVFAGKAHPADVEGQAFAQEIHAMTRKAGLRGRVALIEEYDMHVGRMLTSGCDVWLNTPLAPHEASGTSGMKPPLAGGLNLSILDGWWCEGFDGKNGWAIGDGPPGDGSLMPARVVTLRTPGPFIESLKRISSRSSSGGGRGGCPRVGSRACGARSRRFPRASARIAWSGTTGSAPTRRPPTEPRGERARGSDRRAYASVRTGAGPAPRRTLDAPKLEPAEPVLAIECRRDGDP